MHAATPPATAVRAALGRELGASVRLALPVVVVQLGMVLMGTVDSTMLGHLSAQALAAAALGSIVSFTLLILGSGTLSALDPLIGQAHGAGDARAVAESLQRGLLLAGLLSVPLSLGMANLAPLLALCGEPPGIVRDATVYTRTLIWGNLPFLVFIALRQTLQAMSVVRPALVAIVVGNGVNALANYVLIFGHWGAPALGIRGSAYATSGARWMMCVWLAFSSRRWLAIYFRERRGASGWRGFAAAATDLRRQARLLRIGLPIGAHQSLEIAQLMMVALLMGRLGIDTLAGHQIALNLASVSFMVPLGISGAAATRVGNAIGRGDMPGARRAAAVCLALGVFVMSLFAAAFAGAPRLLASLYSTDPRVVGAAAALLPIAAVFQVFDGTQVVAAGVMRGSADTAMPAAIALLGYWLIALPIGWHLAFARGYGARGLWWGITLGLAVVAALFVARVAAKFRGEIGRVAA